MDWSLGIVNCVNKPCLSKEAQTFMGAFFSKRICLCSILAFCKIVTRALNPSCKYHHYKMPVTPSPMLQTFCSNTYYNYYKSTRKHDTCSRILSRILRPISQLATTAFPAVPNWNNSPAGDKGRKLICDFLLGSCFYLILCLKAIASEGHALKLGQIQFEMGFKGSPLHRR